MEWYRAWRHEERARERMTPRERLLDRARDWQRWVGDALLLGAIVVFAWASMPG